METEKLNSDHKCRTVRVAYEAHCTCGWRSAMIYGGKFGAGGRAAAYDEWRSHRTECTAEEPTP